MAYAVSEDRENVFAALKSGASAYVPKRQQTYRTYGFI